MIATTEARSGTPPLSTFMLAHLVTPFKLEVGPFHYVRHRGGLLISHQLFRAPRYFESLWVVKGRYELAVRLARVRTGDKWACRCTPFRPPTESGFERARHCETALQKQDAGR